jgi:O-antigen/teichoic acid export membrane protein
MQRKFLKNLALLLVLNLLIKPFWIFGIDRTVQNTVGAGEYGFYFAVYNFSFLFYILLDFGITSYNNREIARDTGLLQKHLSYITTLKILLFALYLLFSVGGAFFIQYSPEQIFMLIMLGFNQFMVSFILYLRSNISGLHLFKTDSLISVLDRSLVIVICAVLLWGNVIGEFRIEYFVFAQTASLFITAIITLVIVFRKAKSPFLRIEWDFGFFMQIMRESMPFALLVLLMTFYNRIDSVMLERMLGSDGAWYSGVYASAYRLLDAANMLAYLFAVLLLPIFARMLKQKESPEELIRLSFILLITPAIIMAVASFFYAEQIMHLLYSIHPGESEIMFRYRMVQSSKVFGLLMISFCAISTMYIFSTLLTANGKLTALNIIAFSGMVINILLNIFLIPEHKAYGSAVATLFTQMVIAITQVIVVCFQFKFRYNFRLLVKLTMFILVTILAGYFSQLLPLGWFYNFVLMIVITSATAFLIRLISIPHLMNVLRFGQN